MLLFISYPYLRNNCSWMSHAHCQGCEDHPQLSSDLKSEGSSTVLQDDRRIHLDGDDHWGGLWLGIRDGFEAASPETSPASQWSGWCQSSLAEPAELHLPPAEIPPDRDTSQPDPSAVPADDVTASWSPASSASPQSCRGSGDLETPGGAADASMFKLPRQVTKAVPPRTLS